MKCNATIAVVGKIMTYETCGRPIPKILNRIRHCPWPSSGGLWTSVLLSEPLFVTHATILSKVCTFQTSARFFFNAPHIMKVINKENGRIDIYKLVICLYSLIKPILFVCGRTRMKCFEWLGTLCIQFSLTAACDTIRSSQMKSEHPP